MPVCLFSRPAKKQMKSNLWVEFNKMGEMLSVHNYHSDHLSKQLKKKITQTLQLALFQKPNKTGWQTSKRCKSYRAKFASSKKRSRSEMPIGQILEGNW